MGALDGEEELLPGDRVRLKGLKEGSGLNGSVGTVTGRSEQFDRWQVWLDDEQGEKLFKNRNLEIMPFHCDMDILEVDDAQTSMTRYYIAGTWDDWVPREMSRDQEGNFYSFTAKLGSDGWESFQVWLDGDGRRCLHPDRASKLGCHFTDSVLCGPDDMGHGKNWTIGLHPTDRDRATMTGTNFLIRLHFDGDAGPQLSWVIDEGDRPSANVGHNFSVVESEAPLGLPAATPQLPSSTVASVPLQTNENLRLFLREARPDWSEAEVMSALQKLAKVKVDNVLMLVAAVRGKGVWKKVGLNDKLAAAGETGFADFMMEQMRLQADVLEGRLKPSGQKVQAPAIAQASSHASDRGKAHTGSDRGHEPIAAAPSPVAGRRRSAAGRSQVFRVARPRVDVHARPNANSEVVGRRLEGELVRATEETFDRWAHLDCGSGWLFRGADDQILLPEGDVPLLATSAVASSPGPVKFEVAFEPHVPLCSAPERSAGVVMGLKSHGEVLFAETQTYDGWIRLLEGGWVPSLDPEHGVMLCCTGLDEERARQEQIRSARAVLEDVRTKMHGNDLNHARAFARFKGWSAHLAQLESEDKSRREARMAIQQAVGNKNALASCLADATRCGLPDEVLLARALMARAAQDKAEVSSDSCVLLDAITAAAALGDLMKVASARDIAKAAGLSKKEISRAFALGNSV